jgi:hypothetical protein
MEFQEQTVAFSPRGEIVSLEYYSKVFFKKNRAQGTNGNILLVWDLRQTVLRLKRWIQDAIAKL